MTAYIFPYKKNLPLLVLLMTVLITCNPFDKEYSCKSRLFLTVVNQTTDTVIVTVVDSTEAWYSSKAEANIFNDSFSVIPQQSVTDSIDYQWKEGDGCSYYPDKKSGYAIGVTCKNGNEVIEKKIIFPYDTTEPFISLCKSCLNLSYDTIIIK